MEEQNTTNPNEKDDTLSAPAVQDKPKQPKPKNADKEKKASFSDTVADYKAEFRKIVWPKKDEMMKKTVTVIFTSIMMGVIIFGMDTVFNYGYDLIIKLLG